jgi:surfactin family lipopeptide synthetase C
MSMEEQIQDILPLTPMQQGMLFHSLYAPEAGVYVEQFSSSLHGPLDIAALRQAWEQVLERHSILRTAFIWEGLDEPVQVVVSNVDLPWQVYDLRALAPDEGERRYEEIVKAEQQQSFNLSQAPLLSLTLILRTKDTAQFIWSHHHILLDGWSLSLVLKEVFEYYEAFRQRRPLVMERPRPYRDYIAWLQQQDVLQAEGFWRQMLNGFTAPASLMFGNTHGNLEYGEVDYAERHHLLTTTATAALQSFARQHHLTMNTLIQATWALLLARYTGEHDIVFGVTVSGRPATLAGFESMVGLFINTLPLRVQVLPQAKLMPWLKDLQMQQAELRQYEHTPLVQIQGWSDVPRGQPLFYSLLSFDNYPVDSPFEEQNGSVDVQLTRSVFRTNYPLTVVATPGQELALLLSYDRRVVNSAMADQMLTHLEVILTGMPINPDQCLADLPLLSAAEQQQMLIDWNATAAPYPHDQCLHHLFEAQVARQPDAVAIVFADQHLTYQELNRRANQLAHFLLRHGAKPEGRVAICMERSLELVVGLLGILKAGCAYVPLDPTYPAERLAFMIDDAQATLLLTQQQLIEHLPARHLTEFICLDRDWPNIASTDSENPITRVTPDNLAYIIYTSGSTGRPKGVALKHRGVVNNLADLNRSFGVGPEDRIMALSSLSFDMSVYEILGTLEAGGTIVMPEPAVARDPAAWAELIHRHQVSVWNSAPALLEIFVNYVVEPPTSYPRSLRLAIQGGDWVPVTLPDRLRALTGNLQFISLGGATEASIHSIVYPVEATDPTWKSIPYGRPMVNQCAYILDKQLRPAPVGIPGELHLGGIGLARGYFNRPDLTAEKFVPHPFSVAAGERLYKTGDLARYRPDGVIELLGRMDYQVKIRGFRIELGEIAMALRQHAAIRESVVLVREDRPGDRQLIAYIIAKEPPVPSGAELRHFLKHTLPEYMVPTAFVVLEALPLSANGKVDRRALPAPDANQLQQDSTIVAPRTPVELVIANIWAEVLGIEQVGVDVDFFELGGHSLLATRIISRLQEAFSIIIPLRSLFEAPTVAQFAERLVMIGHTTGMDIVKIAQILLQVDELSDDEVRIMLAEQEQV